NDPVGPDTRGRFLAPPGGGTHPGQTFLTPGGRLESPAVVGHRSAHMREDAPSGRLAATRHLEDSARTSRSDGPRCFLRRADSETPSSRPCWRAPPSRGYVPRT